MQPIGSCAGEAVEGTMPSRRNRRSRLFVRGSVRAPLARAGRVHRLIFGREGSALVETAITFPAVILLLLGSLDFSYAFYTYQDVADAARQASRWAAVRGSTSCTNVPNLNDCNATRAEIQSYVQNLNYPGVVGSNLVVSINWLSASVSTPTSWTACASVCNSPGNEVQVNVTYSFPIAVPYWKSTSFDFSSTGTMVVAQ
jgi:Flp pilus assembly protein TadG